MLFFLPNRTVLRCSHMVTLTVCTFGCPLAVCAVMTLLAAPEAGRQVLTRIPAMTIFLTFKATQQIRDEKILVYGQVPDAQPLWWRWLAEREDVCIRRNVVTVFFDSYPAHAQNALITKFRGEAFMPTPANVVARSRFSAWAFFVHSTRMSPDRSFFTSLPLRLSPICLCEWQKGRACRWASQDSRKLR